MNKYFNKQIFMGCGDPDHIEDQKLRLKREISSTINDYFLGVRGKHSKGTAYQILKLHELIDKALVVISGMQQSPRPGSGEDCEAFKAEYEADKKELKERASEIFMALTGKNPVLDDEIPDVIIKCDELLIAYRTLDGPNDLPSLIKRLIAERDKFKDDALVSKKDVQRIENNVKDLLSKANGFYEWMINR